mmetsp:Transcript_3124/g.7518  ORF Transcript_3124/g.7518 Transcript_3124/m.7518 type:complete len:265 (-) Transcript_3124:106-900(-)
MGRQEIDERALLHDCKRHFVQHAAVLVSFFGLLSPWQLLRVDESPRARAQKLVCGGGERADQVVAAVRVPVIARDGDLAIHIPVVENLHWNLHPLPTRVQGILDDLRRMDLAEGPVGGLGREHEEGVRLAKEVLLVALCGFEHGLDVASGGADSLLGPNVQDAAAFRAALQRDVRRKVAACLAHDLPHRRDDIADKVLLRQALPRTIAVVHAKTEVLLFLKKVLNVKSLGPLRVLAVFDALRSPDLCVLVSGRRAPHLNDHQGV